MASEDVRADVVSKASKIVVKVGTSALTGQGGRLDTAFLSDLAGQIAALVARGLSVTLVSSGAVGAGIVEMDLPGRPTTAPMLQAAAAVGQGRLIGQFHDAFAAAGGLTVGQVLLTRDDFADRRRYLNIRNTIAALHDSGVMPIVNENDTVATVELTIGDNDVLAAHVTNLLGADLLVMLTVVDGVMADGKVVEVLGDPAGQASALATGERSALGRGGMGTKLQAAGMVTSAGEAAVIANARAENVLGRLLDGEVLGTLCLPAGGKMNARRRWIGQAARPAGLVTVDAGAVRALRQDGRSLLPSGIAAVAGGFSKGDMIDIVDAAGNVIARGLSNYPADHVERIKGLNTSRIAEALGLAERPYDEVVHRDNMTIL